MSFCDAMNHRVLAGVGVRPVLVTFMFYKVLPQRSAIPQQDRLFHFTIVYSPNFGGNVCLSEGDLLANEADFILYVLLMFQLVFYYKVVPFCARICVQRLTYFTLSSHNVQHTYIRSFESELNICRHTKLVFQQTERLGQ